MEWKRLPDLPDAEGFAAPFAGAAGDTLLVAGGANFPGKRPWEGGTKIWYDEIFALSESAREWRQIGRLPRPTAYGVSVPFGSELICAGGGAADTHYDDVYALALVGGEIQVRPLPSLPQPCAFLSGCLVNSTFYLAGGISRPRGATTMPSFWALDLKRVEMGWRELPSWPGSPRALAVAGGVGERFYLFGGHDFRTESDRVTRVYLSDAYAFDPERGWSRLADSPRPAVAAPSPAPIDSQGRPLLISGDDGLQLHLDGASHPGFTHGIMAYQPARDDWLTLPDGPISRATVPTAWWHGQWIIPGGERIPGYRSNQVWSLRADQVV